MAAWGNFVLDKGFKAAGALTKYRAVKLTAEETVGPVAADTDVLIGVVQYDVSAAEILKGKHASVRVMGVTEMECGAAITVGTLVTISATGTAVAGTAGDRIAGVCVKGNTGAGRVSVLVTPGLALHP